jgi:hypothetical protein
MKMSDKTGAAGNSYVMIKISSGPEIFPCFVSVFQCGFLFPCQVERTIEDLLLQQLGLNRNFVEEKVNTVFLDGKCVDDISSAILKDGSVAAFSSALPGLAGATLRRGGAYACLRDSITYRQKERPDTQREGLITVKLFNLLMLELGSVFLEKGIVLNSSTAMDLFDRGHEGFWRQVDIIEIDGIPSSRDNFHEKVTFTDYSQIMIRIIMHHQPGGKIVVPTEEL